MLNVLTLQKDNMVRGLLVPLLVGVSALTIAIVGAILIGDQRGGDGVNSFVEGLSGDSSGFFGGLGIIGPLGFAFAAGVAAAFNPCGFAMLPAYMGLYLGSGNDDDHKRSLVGGLGKAVLIGGTVTAGFVVLFASAGTVISLGARSVVADVLPWLGISIGVALTLVGAWLVGGGQLYTALAQRASVHMGNPAQTNV